MPIRDIQWKEGEGYDIHLLRGNHRLDLRTALEFQMPDGSMEDVITYLGAHGDVTLDFQPSHAFTLDLTTVPPLCLGLGVRINNETGQIEVDAPPTPDPVLNNFILHVTATDSTDGKEYSTSVRVHLHNRVTDAWLSPRVLTVRPTAAARPEVTASRFTVMAQFDDGTIGNITHHPNIIWRPSANVSPAGFLIIAAGNTTGSPAVQIEAVLPPDLEDFLSPSPPEIKATGHVRFAAEWAAEATIRTEVVQIQDTWPGTINPELVPNFLFLCDGYKTEDQPQFEGQVRSLLALMKSSQITRPFDLLSTSMNYFRAFVASARHGISVLTETYPNQDADGNIQTEADGVVRLFVVPDPERPGAGNWTLANVVYRIGLPVPSHAALTVPQIRDYWDGIADGIDRGKITDAVVRSWRNLSKRTFLDETDSVFGLAYGNYPSSSRESNSGFISFHPRRMRRSRLDPILRRLTDENGNGMDTLWAEQPDGTRPNSYPLIFIFSSLRWDRGVNFSRGYVSMNVEEDRYWIPARPVPGKPTYEIDLTGRISSSISHGRLIRACHEVAHSFGLGDEYNEKGTLPETTPIDPFYGNLQRHSDIEDATTQRLDGDRIKWRWHRIRKAGVIAGAITEPSSGTFRIPLVLGQANQFAVGDTVLLRVRTYPTPLRRDPRISNQLEVLQVSDFTDASAAGPPAAFLMVKARPGHTFTFADAEAFTEGCIVYRPVRAMDSVHHETDYPFAELMAKNIRDHITARNRALNMDPAAADACVHDAKDIQEPVKLDVDLPFCFKNKNRIVGLYTGGKTYDCGVYHPTGTCIMRNTGNGKEFCAVCRYVLVDIIDPYRHFSIDLDYDEIYPQT